MKFYRLTVNGSPVGKLFLFLLVNSLRSVVGELSVKLRQPMLSFRVVAMRKEEKGRRKKQSIGKCETAENFGKAYNMEKQMLPSRPTASRIDLSC